MKKLLIIMTILMMTGCSNLDFFGGGKEKNITNEYTKLSIRLDRLLENEINEKNRAKLEEDFVKYRNKINASQGKNRDYNDVVREYVKKSDINIQYLQDLKD
ncbi:hypothetical protein [Fusobacterium varium]|uniref:hypothetical protein n=1 Tax=Fusobacterium varium TaxID=856 RepID=UPI000BBAD0A2|nr:hypothetical protein [uncultured Fusobacterium sp.]BBA51393.1 hypothetical protein FV113G1_17430 [Fusobacterium varium]